MSAFAHLQTFVLEATHANMIAVDQGLRVSAQRALLGAIYPEVRLVKVRRDGDRITFTAICDTHFSDIALDALTTAASEIIADFPDCDLDERIIGSADPLPNENILVEGWVFQRAEA